MPDKATKLKEYKRLYYLRNREKILERVRAYAKANPEKEWERQRRWRKENPERNREIQRRHQKKQAHRVNAQTAEYRARKRRAKPKWYDEFDKFVLLEAMRLARLRKHATGFDWHVDHVIPLRGRKVCGLHVWNNFAVIPKHINIRKSNIFHPS